MRPVLLIIITEYITESKSRAADTDQGGQPNFSWTPTQNTLPKCPNTILYPANRGPPVSSRQSIVASSCRVSLAVYDGPQAYMNTAYHIKYRRTELMVQAGVQLVFVVYMSRKYALSAFLILMTSWKKNSVLWLWSLTVSRHCMRTIFSGMSCHKQSGKPIPLRRSADVWKHICFASDLLAVYRFFFLLS